MLGGSAKNPARGGGLLLTKITIGRGMPTPRIPDHQTTPMAHAMRRLECAMCLMKSRKK
ncbi:MAG: hypothetical protein ACI89J_004020 [Hyphomicrobiaceae bacterium]|jgi:hypothetical protein